MKTPLLLKSAALAGLLAPCAALAEPATYPSPEQAVDSFVAALTARDRAALLTVFGPESDDLISSGDDTGDEQARKEFLSAYAARAEIVDVSENRRELQVGPTRWPFPVTLVSVDGGWQFDPAEARDQILDRRIGENELDVIALMRRAVEVQAAFRRVDYDGDGVMEFADAILSDPGLRNGLYWPEDMGEPLSPVAGFAAQASADGISIDGVDQPPQPYLGYYYRILTRQGPAAPGGAMDYKVNGNMVAGHAILAFPAVPGETGVMSFLIGENGTLFEADLGADTLAIAGDIQTFNPGEPWRPVVAD
ncbi:MAG: DUF2950 family protein [Rhodobacter sp.]|nr:DUF2950 family protein [Rhodobacter sp.]MCA3457699.1 DUF2950 family protein [Rhodobacter sp.]MCA3459691.1 DUF2950 family protein [Rhodobacter sp.]MCA3464343.1 DUF2950 family protein [Rhodobacter sp.]MCA3467655.1 DUF2950 family protein [Rhodobacter sp.]